MRWTVLLMGMLLALWAQAQTLEAPELEEGSRELASISAKRAKARGVTVVEDETLRVQKEMPPPYSTANLQRVQDQVLRGESTQESPKSTPKISH